MTNLQLIMQFIMMMLLNIPLTIVIVLTVPIFFICALQIGKKTGNGDLVVEIENKVINLEMNREVTESLIRKIVREESGNNSSPVLNATFVAKLDSGEELGRATIKGIHIVQEIDGKTYVLN